MSPTTLRRPRLARTSGHSK